MLAQEHAQALVHATAYDAIGTKLGKIGQVYLDNHTQAPEWVTVHTGLFGTNESFVPLAGAELDGHRLRLPFDKQRVKNAPTLDPAGPRGGLSPDQELDLYRHYGIDRPRSPYPVEDPGGESGRTSSFGPATALGARLEGDPDADEPTEAPGQDRTYPPIAPPTSGAPTSWPASPTSPSLPPTRPAPPGPPVPTSPAPPTRPTQRPAASLVSLDVRPVVPGPDTDEQALVGQAPADPAEGDQHVGRHRSPHR